MAGVRIRPELFNTEMTRAILDDRKNTTRRLIKGAELEWTAPHIETDPHMIAVHQRGIHKGEIYPKTVSGLYVSFDNGCGDFPLIKSPYRPGDVLYVRETWCWCPCWDCGHNSELGCTEIPSGRFYSKDRREYGCYGYRASAEDNEYPSADTWHPSIHMPREAARIFLQVKNVEVQRLREMVLADVLLEGIEEADDYYETWDRWHSTWDSTIKPTDRDRYGWKANPWVWVIRFERCEKPEGWIDAAS